VTDNEVCNLRCIAIRCSPPFAKSPGTSPVHKSNAWAAFKSARAYRAVDVPHCFDKALRSHFGLQKELLASLSMIPWKTVQSLYALRRVCLTWSGDTAEVKGPLGAIRRMISTGRLSSWWVFGDTGSS